MFIEFTRLQRNDAGITESKYSVNPAFVVDVIQSVIGPNASVIKFARGRGVVVKGSPAEVRERLQHAVQRV